MKGFQPIVTWSHFGELFSGRLHRISPHPLDDAVPCSVEITLGTSKFPALTRAFSSHVGVTALHAPPNDVAPKLSEV